jgi:acyl-coenzyme A thioesterase PaaI-like protein
MLGAIRRLLTEGASGLNARELRLLFRIYRPYLGAGIRVVDAADDYSRWDVEMKLAHYNRNAFGTHFGGSLYSMCDPFFCLSVSKMLGPGYTVWDKEATIRFKRPGRGRVRATFEVSRERVEEIRAEVERVQKAEPTFIAEVRDDEDAVVAEVEKRLHVRRTTKETGAAASRRLRPSG